MNRIQYDEVKKATLAFHEKGGVVLFGEYGFTTQCACPLSCLVRQLWPKAIQNGALSSIFIPLAKHFEVTVAEVEYFASGFDGETHEDIRLNPNEPAFTEWYVAGARLRQELGPIVCHHPNSLTETS